MNPGLKIYSLGCKVNQYDGNVLAAKLSAAGFVAVKNNADLAIINTCAVTRKTLAKNRQMVARARRENPAALIVVAGCAARVYKEETAMLGADLVAESIDTNKIVGQLKRFLPEIATPRQCAARNDKSEKSRYFIKVQDGCRQFCSYCIIPYARGELKSRPAAEVIAEAKQAVAAGHKEIVLCGIHLGLYGIDFKVQETRNKSQTNLASLIKELIKIDGLGRIRLSSIEVNEVTDGLIDLIKKSGKICRHLHIPLQSGNDKILKLMNRPYDTARFAEKIKKIRRALPDIALTTDVIVGFPGETENDFKTTLAFIKKINFSKVHVFPFSAHQRTPAAKMAGQVSEQIKVKRSNILNQLSERLEKSYQQRFRGKKLEVIIDGRSRNGHYRGKTEYYFDIEFLSSEKYQPGEAAATKDWKLL